ncbi:type II toxin-antitoxin system death-on-curing family toxin [Glycomyces sp. TRM65418]|uniref:type II toxin-antitoxin system death-on-curing family toxin n=1 Tax=Glycomyces sp. TRM65418 TaxID=2867006 RepID=UPI001CE5653F|nr:type II toxin-antitoxin system death-on-curing family toxin [Glycomyces sp. TRM65418]MCC3765702.1 type II toxin-antitoxin system death-on-curing family toxin [Glycomyces sp. TRM65418]QZD55296.1 type II toxin-antitoxin system death-on-curing family toxin [Glycomyces sp. TRM65418]
MPRYLSTAELADLTSIAAGPSVVIRDIGLLESAAARPQTNVFGAEAYETPFEKAAALLHSLVSNHPLFDGNKRLGFLAAATFLELNGFRLKDPEEIEDQAYDLVIAAASGTLVEVGDIADRLLALLVK